MAENVAVLMIVLYTRQVHSVEENPAGTYLFHYDSQVFIREMLGLDLIHTWMICFGHFMPKPSRLLGSLVGLGSLAKKYSKQLWEKRRFFLCQQIAKLNISFPRKTALKWYRKRSQRKEIVKYQKKTHGLGTWTSGGKDLKGSAAYTKRFADALLSTWECNKFDLGEPAFSLDELLHQCPFPMHNKRFQCKKSAGPSGGSAGTAQPLEDVGVDPTSRPSSCTCWFNDDPSCRACRRLPVAELAVVPGVPELAVVPRVPELAVVPGVPELAVVPGVLELAVVPGVPELPMILSVPSPSSTSIGQMWANDFEVADFMDTD